MATRATDQNPGLIKFSLHFFHFTVMEKLIAAALVGVVLPLSTQEIVRNVKNIICIFLIS